MSTQATGDVSDKTQTLLNNRLNVIRPLPLGYIFYLFLAEVCRASTIPLILRNRPQNRLLSRPEIPS